MELLGDVGHVESPFHLETVLVSVQKGSWFALDVP